MKNVLNESQIERITGAVNGSSITSAELKEDLIDHLCCIVEDEMSKGKDFETACRTALQRVSPNGLNEIQKETVFLFTSKSRKRLDQIMYVSGFAALTGITLTVAMKMLDVPYSQLALLTTACVVIFGFFPAIFVHLLKQTSGKKNVSYIFGIVGIIGAWLLVLSVVFYIFHWPFPLLAVVCGYIAVFPLFFFKIFKKQTKTNQNDVR